MSEHKTTQSNWTPEQKQFYHARRQQYVRGQTSVITVHQLSTDEAGNEIHVPIGTHAGGALSRSKQPSARAQKRQVRKAYEELLAIHTKARREMAMLNTA